MVGRRGIEPRKYLRIRQAPSTSWVAASRWWRNRASDASQRPIPLQTGACRQAGSPSKGRERSIRSPPPRDGQPLSGRRLQPWQVHSPRRKVHGSNVCGANPATRFQRGTLPLGQPSIRGERAIRTPHRSAHSLAARPGALARSLSVRREGLAPSRPFRATGS